MKGAEMNQQQKDLILNALRIGEFHARCTEDKLVSGSPIWEVMRKKTEECRAAIKELEAMINFEEQG